jgi:hypothetical protein
VLRFHQSSRQRKRFLVAQPRRAIALRACLRFFHRWRSLRTFFNGLCRISFFTACGRFRVRFLVR